MADQKTVEVEIFGQQYKLRGEGDDSRIREIASLVDRRMREIYDQTKVVDSMKLAVLTALNLADELLAAKDDMNTSLASHEDVQANLEDLLDEALKEG